jgi:hypothetical protein
MIHLDVDEDSTHSNVTWSNIPFCIELLLHSCMIFQAKIHLLPMEKAKDIAGT